MSNAYAFPPGFRWGVATAAFQIEGATAADGRGKSVWDDAHLRGLVRTGESGDIACDHYHRFRDDVKLMADLGVKHYRFSISWPRILPLGRGQVNEAGVDFYKRLVDCLGEHGITPYATLFHWDSPQALEDEYGSWRSRKIADDFALYAEVVAKRLAGRVRSWMVMNEIVCFTLLGYATKKHTGMHAPGTVVATERERWQTVHHALLAHGRGVQALRAHAPGPISVCTVDNSSVPVPITETPENIAAARRAFVTGGNGMILSGLLRGSYSDAWRREREQRGELPEILPGDMAVIGQPLDGLGLNNYSGYHVRAGGGEAGFEVLPHPQGYPRLHMPWLNLVPEALYWGPRHIREVMGLPTDKPIFISENGCAADDSISPDGEVVDTDRILYLRTYLRSLHRAASEGYNVDGYFVWSFLDNFEWSWGYGRRFGIIWTDYISQRRIPKLSAKWYAEVVRQNRVV